MYPSISKWQRLATDNGTDAPLLIGRINRAIADADRRFIDTATLQRCPGGDHTPGSQYHTCLACYGDERQDQARSAHRHTEGTPVFILINGAGQPDPGDDVRDGVIRLPAPGFARVAGTVHVVRERRGPVPGVAACGRWLRGAELWRRRPAGQLCLGCFGGEAVAAALRRP